MGSQPARSVAGEHVVLAGGGLARNRRTREGGMAPRTQPRKRSGWEFGCLRTNRRRGSNFPRVRRASEPPDIAVDGGRGIPRLGCGGRDWFAPPRTVWRARIAMGDGTVAPSMATAKIRTNATHFSSEGATRDPVWGWKAALSRLLYSIYGGQSPMRAATE